jgi:putative flavoprotein involved in K+ transport
MQRAAVVVIGAGQAGLAVSQLLTAASVDHVVLERGRTAERWRSQRWDSLRMLTPNWMSRLPGWSYRGPAPTGYLRAGEVAGYLDEYAESFGAPVLRGVDVQSVRAGAEGYLVASDGGSWRADALVIATGHCDQPAVPRLAQDLDRSIYQLTPDRYRNPDSVPDGGVLVVGASATGVQLADELSAAGRDVWLAVGRHTRVPRQYRGMDIMWWLDSMGVLDRRVETIDPAGLDEPSLQLVGSTARRDVDLPSLTGRGVHLTGRVCGVDGVRVTLSDDLPRTTAAADAREVRLLDRIDHFAAVAGLDAEVDLPTRPDSSVPTEAAYRPSRLDLRAAGIRSVLWATGYRRQYRWLQLPVLDGAGEIRHTAGRTSLPGVVVVGMRWQTRRNSTFLDGVRHDAALVVDHLVNEVLGRRAALRRAL